MEMDGLKGQLDAANVKVDMYANQVTNHYDLYGLLGCFWLNTGGCLEGVDHPADLSKQSLCGFMSFFDVLCSTDPSHLE